MQSYVLEEAGGERVRVTRRAHHPTHIRGYVKYNSSNLRNLSNLRNAELRDRNRGGGRGRASQHATVRNISNAAEIQQAVI
jgi:hypothetical protein